MAVELEDEPSSTSGADESDSDDSASLSFCDLPLAGHDGSNGTNSSDYRQLSPPPTDTFEFFSGNRSTAEEMCSAEDVFLKGKLVSYKPPPSQPSPAKRSDDPTPKTASFDHRRSESLDGINQPRGRGELVAEYRRLRRAASDSNPRTPPPPPPPPPKSSAMSRSRPKWYMVVFGPVRVPAAMEMKDIRNRQRRRRTPLLAECDGLRCEGAGRGPWKLLHSLSCKAAGSAVVASPFRFFSHPTRSEHPSASSLHRREYIGAGFPYQPL